MNRKEEIIFAALELAAEKGLGSISMQQIADKIGIKKPSLYNHFKSKDEIVSAMYEMLRSKAQENAAAQPPVDAGELLKKIPPAELLKGAVSQYFAMITGNRELLLFYRVLYSSRTSEPAAAAILAEETKRMIAATKNLFYAIQIHSTVNFPDIDTAAETFAYAVHAMTDHMMDCEAAGIPYDKNMLENYAERFCKAFEED